MLFHVGALFRLDEAGALPKLSRISSVSGGSITAAYLGLMWQHLRFGADGRAGGLQDFVDGIRRMARTSVDAGSIIGGILLPGSVADRVASAYSGVLFGDATLQDLPDDAGGAAPFFVINATNVKTSALWRFTRRYMGDYRVGLVNAPTTRLGQVVAASSAFPPLLSPLELEVSQPYDPQYGGDLTTPAFRDRAVLSDGGVYDNLGLETVYKNCSTVLVSDAGQKIAPETDPKDDWARHSIRILDIVDNQVRSLRKRALIAAYSDNRRTGTYWGIRTHFEDYEAASDPLACANRDPTALAEIPTRLQAMPDDVQEKLINWGYAITDAALRRHFDEALQAQYGVIIKDPLGFPYPIGY
jgi:NTE family protein